MKEILDFLAFKGNTPTLYGLYHIFCLFIVLGLSTLIIIKRKKISEKMVNRILIISGLAFIILEIYKQIIIPYDSYELKKYPWYIFPFAFCSTPLYITALAGFLKKGKLKDYLLCYLSTYSLLAGICVMIYPGDVFVSLIGINIQTMVIHGGMIVLGVLLLATNKVKKDIHTFYKGLVVFLIFLTIAVILNLLWPLLGINETFNMFQISPYYDCSLPIFNVIKSKIPYIIFLLLYIIPFSLGAYIIYLIYKLTGKEKSNEK